MDGLLGIDFVAYGVELKCKVVLYVIEHVLHRPTPWTVWSMTDHLMPYWGNKIPDQVMLV